MLLAAFHFFCSVSLRCAARRNIRIISGGMLQRRYVFVRCCCALS